MDRYNLRRPRINRELTEEEQQELDGLLNYDSNNSESESDIYSDDDSEYEPQRDNESVYDESDENNALDDVELEELNRSIEIDANELQVEPDNGEDDIDAVQANRGQKYVGQRNGDKTVWWSMATEDEKMRTKLLKRDRMSSFAHCTRSFDEKKEAFMHIFPPAIIGQIVLETNRKAKKDIEANRHVQQPKHMRPWKDTNTDELYAYIAILIYAGAEKANLVKAKDLFAPSNMAFYRAVMSLYRYEQLTRYLRFDDSKTRLARLRTDKLAPIRYIWEYFLKNLTSAFVPSLELCIDEQLLVTRKRCSFRQYIPSKPGKYGIKIFWLVDAKKNYPVSGEIYLGTQPYDARNNSVAKNLVMRLSKNYLNIGSNITMDNFFTSYQLARELAAKNTTLVGTIRVNKRELPKDFASVAKAKERAENSAVFCFSNECELVSYVTRTKKNVCLLSTAHATEDLNPETGKPVVVHDYNEHKGGVDKLDKMLRCYTTKRKNDRWPMLLFYNIIDVGAFAAYRLFELSHPAYRAPNYKKRKSFLKDLAFELAKNHLKSRSEMPHMRSSLKIALALIGIKTENIRNPRTMPQIQVSNRKRRCETCKRNGIKTDIKTICDLCSQPTCTMHYVRACKPCYLYKFIDPDLHERSEEEDNFEEEAPLAKPSTVSESASKRRRKSIINI